MKPYFKLVFGTDTGGSVIVNVPDAKTFSEAMLPIVIDASMSEIIIGNSIKTKDGGNLISANKAFYCTTDNVVFDVAE